MSPAKEDSQTLSESLSRCREDRLLSGKWKSICIIIEKLSIVKNYAKISTKFVLYRLAFLTPLFSTEMKIGQPANQVLSKMKNLMEQWLWLAHWHLFHFGAKRGKPFKRITLYVFSLFWSGLFSFAEIFSGQILVSIDPKKKFHQ